MPYSNIDLGNIGSGNGLLTDRTKLLPELMFDSSSTESSGSHQMPVLQEMLKKKTSLQNYDQIPWGTLCLCAKANINAAKVSYGKQVKGEQCGEKLLRYI